MGLITLGIGGGATLGTLLLTGLSPAGPEAAASGPMRQVIMRRTPAAVGNICLDARASTTFGFGGFSDVVMPYGGTFKNFVLTLTVAPGTGASRRVVMLVNGVAAALDITLSDSDTTETLVTDVTVALGDRVRLSSSSPTGVPATADYIWSLEFEPDDEVSVFYGTNIGNDTAGFVDLFGGGVSLTAANQRRLIPCDGTITSMVALNTFDSVTAPDALNLYFYKNGVKQDGAGGTVDTLLSHTDAAINTEVVSTFSLPVVRGDNVYVGIEEAGTYPASWLAVTMTFVPDVPGNQILATRAGNTPSDTNPNFAILMSLGTGPFVWDAPAEDLAWHCGVSSLNIGDLILEAEDDPGAGNTRAIALLRDGAYPPNGPAGDITTGSLIIDDDRYAAYVTGEEVGPLRHIPESTPTITGRVWFSLVMTLGDPDDPGSPPEEPPEEGGELPEPTEPLEADLPVGIVRIFALLTYGSGSPYSEIAFAETDLNDPDSWYGGHKAPWLLGVSTIERELTDSLRGVEVTVTAADPDRVFRGLAETDTLSGAIMEIFLVSDTVRYALGEPHRRFAGRVHEHRATPGFQYEFVLRDILSEELANLADAPRIPPGRLTAAQFPGMTADYENKAIPILLGEVSDESETTPQGVVPPLIVAPSINLASAFGGVNVDVVAAILSHGAIHPYAFLQGYYNTVDDPYTRIPIPASAWGTILTAPGQAGWNYVGVATDYIDYPISIPDSTHRYTPVFFLASDPNVQAVLDGRIQVAFNPYGLTENADGTGRYFSDAPDIYEFLIRNWLYPPHWRYGEYNSTPTLPRGYTIVNHDSVVTSRDRLRGFLGSPTNYPVGFMLGRGGQQQTLRHVLTELCHGVLMEQGFDRHGRIILDVEDPDAVATMNLSDVHDIEAGEFVVWVDRSNYRNTAEYVFGYRYLPAIAPLPTPPEGETLPPANVGEHNDWSSVAIHTHDAAVIANQGRLTAPLQLENFVVRNSDVAQNWAERNIDRLVGPGPSYDGQRLCRLTTSWQNDGAALGLELGDVISIDHVEGMGSDGFIGMRFRILKITDDLQAARITFEGRILYPEGSPS